MKLKIDRPNFFLKIAIFWVEKKTFFESKSNWSKIMLKVYILVQNCFPSLIGCISGQNSYFRHILAELRFFEKIDFFDFFAFFSIFNTLHHLIALK